MRQNNNTIISRFPFFIPASLVLAFLPLAVGCSGSADKEANPKEMRPDSQIVLQCSYDENSLRFEDEQLVLDVVVRNASKYDLHDVEITTTISRNDKWEKKSKFPSWRRFDECRVAVPVLNNDLDEKDRPSRTGPMFNISASGFIKVEATMVPFGDPPRGKTFNGVIITGDFGASPMGEKLRHPGWRPWGDSSFEPHAEIRGEVGHLHLSKIASKLPALKNVKLLVVGYTGKEKKTEQFRRLVSFDSIGDNKVSISLPPIQFTEFRIRGVGQRVIGNADDLAQQKQVFYLCDNYPIEWK